MKITEALFAEHLVFHNMFDHIEAAAPKFKTLAEVKSQAALMEQLLKAHSDTEDELFIGPLEHCFGALNGPTLGTIWKKPVRILDRIPGR